MNQTIRRAILAGFLALHTAVFARAETFGSGLFDQGGNVYEWNDGVYFGSSRVLRGGAWDSVFDSFLSSSYQNIYGPTYEDHDGGFRVATVPEPSVAVSLLVTGAWLLTRRKRP